jgi:hypothetical protein
LLHLKNGGYINDDIEDFLYGKFEGTLKDLFAHEISNVSRQAKGYTVELP